MEDAMKSTNKILLVLMVLACLFIVGCDNPNGPANGGTQNGGSGNNGNPTVKETWTKITTFKGLDGIWECTMEEEVEEEGIKLKASATLGLKIEGEKCSQKQITVVDYTPIIEALAVEGEITADELWAEFVKSFVEDKDWSFSYSEGKPYTVTGTMDWQEADENDMFDGVEVFVNNTKTKIKAIESVPMYDEETWEPVLDENGQPVMEKVTMIFVKK